MNTAKILMVLMVIFCTASAWGQSKSAAVLLQEGLYAEETEGDLQKAIGIYEQVLGQAGETERIMAKATYQLGMCYLKKGDNQKAGEYFQEVVSKYAKQNVIAKKANDQLQKIEPVKKPTMPIIVETSPKAFLTSVSPDLTKVTVTFDQPMMDQSWSWVGGGDTYPKTGKIYYDPKKTICTLPVKLMPGKVYWIGINSPSHKNFKNPDGIPCPRYVIIFATKDENGNATSIPQDMLERARAINLQAKKIMQEAAKQAKLQDEENSNLDSETEEKLRSFFVACGTLCDTIREAVSKDDFQTAESLCQQVEKHIADAQPLLSQSEMGSMMESLASQFKLFYNAVRAKDKEKAIRLGNALNHSASLMSDVIMKKQTDIMSKKLQNQKDEDLSITFYSPNVTDQSELLKLFNLNLPSDVETYQYRPRMEDGKLIATIKARTSQGKAKVIEMIKKSAYLKLVDSSSDKEVKLKAEDLIAQGWQLWKKRKLQEAEDKFNEAITVDLKAEGAWQGLGWSQLNQGKTLNAKESLEKCIEINPKNSAALNGLGWIAHGQGDIDNAISWWEKAVEAQPGATASLSGLTQVYMERKEYDKAAKYYQMWLKVEPNNQQAKEGLRKANAG